MRAYVAGLALLLPLAGCGSSDAEPSSMPDAASATPAAAPTWNPCADLAAAPVGRALGAQVTEETGTDDNPRCAFLPVAKGGPTLNVTYLWYDGSFADAFDSMGRMQGTVTDLHLPGANAARLVVNAGRPAVLVTGFVKTGRLVETVNAIALAPYDRRTTTAAVTGVMRALVRHAPASEDDASAS